jgi:hypothetical protein|tara:strand:- start:44 stop:307 length:264 start_codon:yes stop_codon:yes gene_type:complete
MEQNLIPITEIVQELDKPYPVLYQGYLDTSTIWRFREIKVDKYKGIATLIIPNIDPDQGIIVKETIEEVRQLLVQSKLGVNLNWKHG